MHWMSRLKPFDAYLLLIATYVYWLGAITKFFAPAYSDIGALFYAYVVRVHHAIPYLTFSMEYPPPISMLIWFAGQFTWLYPPDPSVGYMIIQAIVIFPFALAIVYYSLKIAEQIGTSKSRVGLLIVVSITFVQFTFYNWDAPAVALMLCAMHYFLKKRIRFAYASLALAAAIKIYPLILLPLFWVYSDSGWKPTTRRLSMLGCFMGLIVLTYLPAIILASGNVFNMLYMNFVTGANFWIEDSWLMYLNIFVFQYQYGLTRVVSYLIIAGMGLLALFRFRGKRDNETFVRLALLLVIAGFFGFTGTPPQFFLMVLPLMALVKEVNSLLTRYVDLLNVLIILVWSFSASFNPFGFITMISSLRQWLLFAVYLFLLLNLNRTKRRSILEVKNA